MPDNNMDPLCSTEALDQTDIYVFLSVREDNHEGGPRCYSVRCILPHRSFVRHKKNKNINKKKGKRKGKGKKEEGDLTIGWGPNMEDP